jgi:predicted transcriptional regulator
VKIGNAAMIVFRCSETLNLNDERIDNNMLKILRVLDGYRSLASIAFTTGISMSEFQKAIKALISLGFIRPVAKDRATAD